MPITALATKVSFACPVAGTRTETTNANGNVTRSTWDGADPSDPEVCLNTNSRGRQTRNVYGFYALPIINEPDIRKAMSAAFAGATEPQCFQTTVQADNVGGTNATYIYERCWKQLGRATVTQDGRPVNVVVFAMSDEGKAGNYYAADWVYYYDPTTGVVLQGDVTTRRGTPTTSFKRKIVRS